MDSARPQPGARLVGRDRELKEILEVLRGPAPALAGVAITGDAGIGKTRLFRAALEAVARDGFLVLRASPTERERHLPFAALQDMLGQLPARVREALPAPQRDALAVVLLEASPAGGGIDERTLGTAVASTISSLAATRAVIIAVDDVQWLDRATADALTFAMRRLAGGPVRVLLTRRSGGTRALGLDRQELIAQLTLGPLSTPALHELLRGELGHAFANPDLRLIWEWSAGNPLLALEVGRWFLAHPMALGQTAGRVPPVLPAESLLEQRIGRLPGPMLRPLLVVALAGRLSEDGFERACRSLGWPPDLPGPESNLLERSHDGELRLGHPLLAGPIVSRCVPSERRRVHAVLAELQPDPIRRARHLALAVDGADAKVAAEIDRAARLAEASGAAQDALELMELAARRTPRDATEVLQERHLHLGDLARRLGDRIRAEGALRAAAAGPARSIALAATTRLLEPMQVNDPEAPVLAARARSLARGDARGLAEVALALPGTEHQRYRHAAAARRLLERCEADALLARAIAVEAAAAMELGRTYPADRLDRAIELERDLPIRSVADSAAGLRAWMDSFMDDHRRSREAFGRLRARAEGIGDEASLPAILRNLAHVEIRAGRWADAESLARETIAAAERTGQPGSVAIGHLQLGAVASLRGDGPVAERELGTAEELAIDAGQPFIVGLTAGRRGAYRLSIGDPQGASEAFERSRVILRSWGHYDPALTNWRGEHVEALVQLGRLDDAREVVADQASFVAAWSRPVSVAILERSRGLVSAAEGDVEAAAIPVARSVEALRRLQDPFQLARSLHVAGSIERRRRKKAAAARFLTEAIAILEELGGAAWADRARDELRRVGLRPRAPRELTETERLVAELAATGLTNREVAERAFLSPRTVEDVLSRVYGKLAIGSRAELGAAMSAQQHSAAARRSSAH